MNLINFHVTNIISEKTGKVYQLYDMTEEEVNQEPEEWWKEYLLSNGIKQEYEFWDDGGTRTDSKVFNLDKLEKPYYIGYIGTH